MDIEIRNMTIADYDEVFKLWKTIHGFAIRSIDDSRENTEKFLKRNPNTSVVAIADDHIVGALLCGHDGRNGSFYHVCVEESYRMHGIGKKMATACMRALQKEGINKVALIAFKSNQVGNQFWHEIGWTQKENVNYYEFILNEENIIKFNE